MRILLVSCLLLNHTLMAADKPLAQAAEKAATELKAGGIVTGESLDGKVTFASFASAQDKQADYNEKVLFEIGSITKVFTGLLLAQAVVDGKVTLETPISKLLDPKLKFEDPRIAAITLKQLSTHTSGLPRLPDNHGLGVQGQDPYAGYNEKLLLNFLTTAKLQEDGPHQSSYSNVGVGLLGYLLGKVYGMPWEDAVVSKICEPLGLHHTRMTIASIKLPLAKPHDQAKDEHSWHFDTMAGAGALRSTAADLLKFGQAMAKPESTPLAKAFALAMQPHANESGPSSQIGLGPFIEKRDGVLTFHHGGGTGGYRSGLQVIPEKNVVRVVLVNNTSVEPEYLISQTRTAPARVMPKEIKMDIAKLQDFTGVYPLNQQSRLTILLHDGQLWTRLTGQSFLPLFAKAEDQFFLKPVDAEVHFSREEGKVVALTLLQNGREIVAKRSTAPVPPIALHTAKELADYAGKYFLFGITELNVTVRGNTLFAQLAGQEAAPIFDFGKDRFEFDVVEAALIFNRDEKGRIVGLTLSQNGRLVPAARGKASL